MRLRYIALGVEDVESEAAFLREVFGLEEHRGRAGYVAFSAAGSPEPYVIRLRKALQVRVDLIAFAVPDRVAVDALRNHAMTSGSRIVDLPESAEEGAAYGFAVFDPDGHLIQISEEHPLARPVEYPGGQGRPVDISHVVLNTTDNTAMAAWYCDVLGFRVTDWLEDKLVFTTSDDRHHQLAFAAAPNLGTNHIAFECRDVDDFMRATGRALRRGNEILWGPGRHGPGDNAYAYFKDPAGFIMEFTTGLEEVAATSWTVRTWQSTPEQSDLWGTSNPRPNEAFLTPADPGLGTVPGSPGER